MEYTLLIFAYPNRILNSTFSREFHDEGCLDLINLIESKLYNASFYDGHGSEFLILYFVVSGQNPC